MPNTVIQLKKSATPTSTPADLANGELAINFADGKLFYKNTAGFIAEFSGAVNSFGTVNANGTLVVSDTSGDVLTLLAGNNITIVGDAVNDRITVGLTNNVVIPGTFKIGTVGGDEGGEIALGNAVTNSVLSGDVKIDIYQNRLRFFESGSPNRGAFIDLSIAGSGVGSNLLATGGGTDTTARATAEAAFAKANAALPNTNGATFAGTLTASANLVADRIISLNNNNAENYKVGDDAWIGDTNLADTIRIKGIFNSSNAYIAFGNNDGITLGRSGSGNLTYGGNTVWHAGIDGAGSGLDADLLDGQQGSFYAAAATLSGANTAVGTGANSFVSATIAGANTAVGTGANTYLLATIAGANTAVGGGANNFLLAVIAGSNTAVGTGANAFATSAAAGANAYMIAVQNGSNTAVGAGANTVGSAAFAAANTKLPLTGGTITGDLTVVGNLSFSGNTTFSNVQTLSVNDPLIFLASNNTSDIVDIGFIGLYSNGTANVHTGLYREHENKMYYLFQGYDKEPVNNHLGALSNNMTLAVLNADIRTSNLSLAGANLLLTLAGSNVAVGTGANSYAATVGTGANNYLLAVIAGANTAVGTGANTVGSAAFTRANSAQTVAIAAFDKANMGGSVAISDTAPSSPTANSLWWSSDLGKMFIYYNDGSSNQWVETSPSPDTTEIFSTANSARDIAVLSFNRANSAQSTAIAAFSSTNTTSNVAISSFTRANSAQTIAVSAFNSANTAVTTGKAIAMAIVFG